jgi:RNA-directed DNA polymerase
MQFSTNKAGNELIRHNKNSDAGRQATDRRSPETGTQTMARMESGVDKATKRRGRLQGCLSPFIVPEKWANRRPGGSQQREGTDRQMGASEGNTMGTTESEIVCTRQGRIAELAGQEPKFRLLSLNKNLDMVWLREAHKRTRKDGATGVDSVTAEEYAKDLEARLENLKERAKSGTYHAPPVRRTFIPKGDGRMRPLGIPTFEDKVLQRAVVMLLEPVYEQEFLDCAMGYRPERSAHTALEAIWRQTMQMGGCWLIDADIKGFFDTVAHGQLKEMLNQRVGDGVIRRLVSKWLHAGVWEAGQITHPETGTPQGGVISPMLSNIYLHEVLDKWFEEQIKPRLESGAFMVRYADDFVMGFKSRRDAERVLKVLGKRLAKFGLELHSGKTRLVDFRPTEKDGGGGSFDFLGLTHTWRTSRKGRPYVGRQTAKSRFTRALSKIKVYCRKTINLPLKEQWEGLKRRTQGHYQYYGIQGNSKAIGRFAHEVKRVWLKSLRRRSGHHAQQWTWERFNRMLGQNPLPEPRIRMANA